MHTAKFFADAARSTQTKACYASDLRHFKAHGPGVPASSHQVARYLARFATDLSVATLQRRLWAIQEAHLQRGFPNPVADKGVRDTMKGIKRIRGSAQKNAVALTRSLVLQLAQHFDQNCLWGMRNRAMILLGFSGAFRRSELVTLSIADLCVLPGGIRVTIRRSKTDQEGLGRTVWIASNSDLNMCAVEGLRRWLGAAKIVEGPLFRKISKSGLVGSTALSPQTLNIILKHGVAELWGDEAAYRVSGHSLRAGFVTEAAQQGMPLHVIRGQTGHKSMEALTRYIRLSGDQHVPAL